MRTFSQDTKKAASGFMIAVLIVVAFALLGSIAKADEPCTSSGDTRHLSNIAKNQKAVSENREERDRLTQAVQSGQKINPDDVDGYNAFTEAKGWNAAEVDALAANGCSVDWSQMKLVPLE